MAEAPYPPVLSPEIVRRLCGLAEEVVWPLNLQPDHAEPWEVVRLVEPVVWPPAMLLRYVWREN